MWPPYPPQRGELSAFYLSVGGIFGGRRFFNSYVSFIINFLSSLQRGNLVHFTFLVGNPAEKID